MKYCIKKKILNNDKHVSIKFKSRKYNTIGSGCDVDMSGSEFKCEILHFFTLKVCESSN